MTDRQDIYTMTSKHLTDVLIDALAYVRHRINPELCDGMDCYVDEPKILADLLEDALEEIVALPPNEPLYRMQELKKGSK